MAEQPLEALLTIRGGKAFSELDLIPRQFMAAMMPLAFAHIRKQVQSGLDAEGKPLPEYSENWKKIKTRRGTYRGHTDYTDTGELWTGVAVNYLRKWTALRLYFKGASDKGIRYQRIADRLADRRGRGRWSNARKNSHTWFALNDAGVQMVDNEYLRRVVQPGLRKLRPAIRISEIPPAFRKHVTVRA